MERRKFIKNTSIAYMSLSLPFLSNPLSFDKNISFLTSIPPNFPILGKEMIKLYGKLSETLPNLTPYKSNLNHWHLTHPNRILTTKSQHLRDSSCFLSTLGEDLSTKDYRLSLIENLPFIGKTGDKIISWLYNDNGLKYWQAAASDWGLHVLPAMVVDSTHLGWINQNLNIQNDGYSNLKVNARGTVSMFFDRMGSHRSHKSVKEINSHLAENAFVQMLNKNLDLEWHPEISNFETIGSSSKSGALLLGLYFPKTLWNSKLSKNQQTEIAGICKASLYNTQKLTSFKDYRLNRSRNNQIIKKDFLEFVYDELIPEVNSDKHFFRTKLV